jgi:3-oxoisoapionate decarboxylase
MNRRHFLQSASTAALAATVSDLRAATESKTLIGLDHFAVRSTGWKAPQMIEYAGSLKLDVIFLSELTPFESTEEGYLKKLKEQADALGLKIYSGGMSICPTANRWKDTWGTPEEHMALLIRVAKTLGSPVARCVLGDAKDRTTEGGIERHIEECLKVFKASKSRCEAEGVKISIENHAGDMQSHELKALVEAAGKDFVGVNIDPGNAVWALEDPMMHLETLGPYVNCSSIRDSMVWETEEGASVQWTAVGEGLVDWKAYTKRFRELAPHAPLNIETISGFAKPFPYKKDKEAFMKPFAKMPEATFEAWKALAARGKKIEPYKAPDKEAEAAYQKGDFENSVTALRLALA